MVTDWPTRQARLEDIPQIIRLLHTTITTINARDYSPEQIQAWVARTLDWERWADRIQDQYFLVALNGETIIGIGSLAKVYSDVSITARLFFEKRGYLVRKEQQKWLQNVAFINYRMTKQLQKTAG